MKIKKNYKKIMGGMTTVTEAATRGVKIGKGRGRVGVGSSPTKCTREGSNTSGTL